MFHAQTACHLTVRLAQGAKDLRAVQALRYQVFAEECGANGAGVDHARRLEADHCDTHADHLLVLTENGDVIGTTRLMTQAQARAAGGFYSAQEYDLAPLLSSQEGLLELSRTCLLPAYRGGAALLHLWRGVAAYARDHHVTLLFGVASLPGIDPSAHLEVLSLLDATYRAPDDLCPQVRAAGAVQIPLIPLDKLDRRRALTTMPPLLKSYLRLGARVGRGAYIDRAFNTTDVCVTLRADQLPDRQRTLLTEGTHGA